jgi:NADH-quinone oxidoreductase subunit L
MSTCSQLGYMVMCCGLGLYKLALTHLVFHGVFKGLLFLTSANIINIRAGEQNLFKGG